MFKKCFFYVYKNEFCWWEDDDDRDVHFFFKCSFQYTNPYQVSILVQIFILYWCYKRRTLFLPFTSLIPFISGRWDCNLYNSSKWRCFNIIRNIWAHKRYDTALLDLLSRQPPKIFCCYLSEVPYPPHSLHSSILKLKKLFEFTAVSWTAILS